MIPSNLAGGKRAIGLPNLGLVFALKNVAGIKAQSSEFHTCLLFFPLTISVEFQSLHFLLDYKYFLLSSFGKFCILVFGEQRYIKKKKILHGTLCSSSVSLLLLVIVRALYLITQMVPSCLTFFAKDTKYCELMPHGTEKSLFLFLISHSYCSTFRLISVVSINEKQFSNEFCVKNISSEIRKLS